VGFSVFLCIIFFKKFCCNQKASIFVFHNKISIKITMNKAELIAKVSDDAGITKTQANEALDSFVEAVTKTLKGGGKVTLVGFGTFSVSKRAARNGRNPQTGAVIKIKAKKVAKFKAGKELSAKL
jgi:DNA-binding protein HU-beta